jgi:myo-inositol-1(or 4)-monophosphatase
MPESPESPSSEWLSIALTAARSAASFVRPGWRARPAASLKGRIELVTQFDLDSETLLRSELSRATPFPVVGEERGGEASRDRGLPTWYVDPIDGTTNFVHGHPFWCVSVGLARDGIPILGAVVAPSLGLEWAGAVDLGATRCGQPCTVSNASAVEDALLATGFPYDRRSDAENNFDAFVAIKKRCQAVRRCGSAAIDLCFVADGTYDGYWERKVKPWDVAAGSAIVLAAGGNVTDYGGQPANVACGQIIATNGRLHGALVGELAKVSAR